MTCALPYHSTPDFVKLVQLANLEGTSFYFLKHVKERGAAPPRDQLVARCVNDAAFLSFVCDAAAASASAKVRPGLTTPLPSLVSEPAKNLASAISDEKSQSRARMSELRGPVRSRLLRSRLACSLVTSRVSFLRPFGPPPFLPSDAAAIRGVKQPRRDRLASRWKIASEPHEKARRRFDPRSQRTARTAMDERAYWPSLISPVSEPGAFPFANRRFRCRATFLDAEDASR